MITGLKSGSDLLNDNNNQYNQALDFLSFSGRVEPLGNFTGECNVNLLSPLEAQYQGTVYETGPSGGVSASPMDPPSL